MLGPRQQTATTALMAVSACALMAPAGASAAAVHAPLLASASIFSSIGHALLGGFSWTFGLASKFLLTTLAALVRLLIPRSWVHEGVQIMGWIVAVPNYAGQITTPSGAREYGFGGINDLRELFMWLGIATAPLTLTHATARALIDESEPVAIPYLRVVATAAVIVLYPYLWTQAADLADLVTHLILNVPEVTDGLRKLMEYAVGGVALGGWQLIDLGLMGAIAAALLGLIFMKVVLILVGALLYATGPLMIGLVATRFGHAIARAWLSAAMFLLGIGIAWAAIFAVGALLIDDATTAGPLIAGNSTFGSLIGGVILAVAGLVALWLCLKVAREAGGLLRLQLGGMLALGAGGGLANTGSRASAAPARTTSTSLRQFGSRVAAGTLTAGAELSDAMPGGRHVRSAIVGAAGLGRRGLIGSAAIGARSGAHRAAAPAARILGSSRAGAVAVRMARSGTAAYHATPSATKPARQSTGSRNTARRPRPRPATAQPAAAGSSPRRAAQPPTVNSRASRSGQAARPSSPAVAVSGGEPGASRLSPSQPATVTSASRSPHTGEQPTRPPAGRAAAPRTTRPTSAAPRPARSTSTPPPAGPSRPAGKTSTPPPATPRRQVRWRRPRPSDGPQEGRRR